MIVVTVSLDQYGLGERVTELVKLRIANDGTGGSTKGNYNVQVVHPSGKLGKTGRVENYPRKAVAVGNLIRRSLEAVGYTK